MLRVKNGLIALAAGGLLTPLVAACGNSAFVVKGSLTVPIDDPDATEVGSTCLGQGGFDDIAGGAQIVIKDDKGERVAVGRLDNGKVEEHSSGLPGLLSCRFPYSIPDVPDDGDIYTISIGSRDDYSFKKSEAADLQLSLGG